MGIKECSDKKLLKKIPISKLKIDNSLKISEDKLSRSKELFKKDFFNEALISAYTSMFHAARALLYRDGVQEKSHFAVYVYIKEKYHQKILQKLIESFRVYQLNRHEVLYGFDYKATKEDAESAISDSEEFLQKFKEILNHETFI